MPRQYTKEFKKQLVDLHNSGKSLQDIEREYGVPYSTVRGWVKLYNKSGSFLLEDSLSDDAKTIKAMQKELKRLQMENDILKHAALILGRKDS
jgi:transposase